MYNKLKLIPPRNIYRRTRIDGRVHRELIDIIPNDEGKIINGRIYTYHPTKGWRSRQYNETLTANLTLSLVKGLAEAA